MPQLTHWYALGRWNAMHRAGISNSLWDRMTYEARSRYMQGVRDQMNEETSA